MYLLDMVILLWQSPDVTLCCVPQIVHFVDVANEQGMETSISCELWSDEMILL